MCFKNFPRDLGYNPLKEAVTAIVKEVSPSTDIGQLRLMYAGPSRIASAVFPSADDARQFLADARWVDTRWYDALDRTSHVIALKGDRSTPEQAMCKLNGRTHSAAAVTLIGAGWEVNQFKLLLKRDKLYVEDLTNTQIHLLAQYSRTWPAI